MIVIFSLHSRAAVFALTYVALMFFTCSQVAGAGPITNPQHGCLKDMILRPQRPQCSHHLPPSAGLQSTDTKLQSATGKSVTSGNKRKTRSIIDSPSYVRRFTGGEADHNLNTTANGKYYLRIRRVHRRYGAGGTQPASSVLTSDSQHGGQSSEKLQPRGGGNSLLQKVYPRANLFDSHSMMIRKSSPKPFAKLWDQEYTRKSLNSGKKPEDAFVEVLENIPVHKSLFPSKLGGYLNNLSLLPRGHGGPDRETSERPAAGARSRSSPIQSGNLFSFTSRTTSQAPSITNGTLVSAVKKDPSPEKLTPSITHFSHEPDLMSGGQTVGHKKVQSYLFKDTQTLLNRVLNGMTNDATAQYEQRPVSEQGPHRFAANFQQFDGQWPNWQRDTNPLKTENLVRQNGGQAQSLNKRQPHVHIRPQSQLPVSPSPVKMKNLLRSAPSSREHSRSSDATRRENSSLTDQVTTARKESMRDYAAEQYPKRLFNSRGFKSPLWRALKPSTTFPRERPNLQRYSFGKFKTADASSSLSPRYSFGREAAATATVTLEQIRTDYTSPAPPMQTSTVSTARPFTSGFRGVQRLLPENDTNLEAAKDGRLKIYKRIYSLKGFDFKTLNRSQSSLQKPDKGAILQRGFEGLKLRVPQIWQTGSVRVHRWNNQTGGVKPESSRITTLSRNEPQRDEPLLKATGSEEFPTRVTPDRKNYNFFSLYRFWTLKNKTVKSDHKPRNDAEQNATEASPPYKVASAQLRRTQDLDMKQSPSSEPRRRHQIELPVKKATLLRNNFSSSSVRGKRVNVTQTNGSRLTGPSVINMTGHGGIVRKPRPPARIKSDMYPDIVGSALFSGIRATNQTKTSVDDDDLQNSVVQWARNATSETKSRAENKTENLHFLEENSFGEHKYDKILTSDFSQDQDGSGDFNPSDIGRLSVGNNLAELDYLQRSTWNVSFKSVNLSPLGQNQ